MKPLKLAAIVVGILLLLVAAGIGFFIATIDTERIKGELTRIVLEKKQRTLKIDGAASLSFFPGLGVRLGKVSLSERGTAADFAAVEAARVSIRLWPLLSKNIVVDELDLEGLQATLIRHKDGSLNIADLLSDDKDDSQPVQFDISGIRIGNSRLSWRDEQSGQRLALTELALSTGRLSNAAAGDLKLSARLQGEQPQLDAMLRLAARYDYDLAQKHFALSRLDGELQGKQGANDYRFRLQTPALAFAGDTQSLKLEALALDIGVKAGEASVKAALKTPLIADLQTRTVELSRLDGEFDIAHPRMPARQLKLPMTGRLKLDLARQNAVADFTTRFDETRIRADIKINRFSPLALGFDLDIDRINLDKYMPPAAAGDDDIDLSLLKTLDLKGTVKIGSLQAKGIRAEQVRFDLKAANGKLDIAPHSARLYDGSLQGKLTLDAADNAVALRENLSEIRIAPLMKAALNKDWVEGRGDIVLALNARGETVTAMKQSLSGTARLALKDGAIRGIDLARSLGELKMKLSARQDVARQADAAAKTDFTELSASFVVDNGVARNEDLSAKSPFLRLNGGGDIDIGNGRMNYLLRASVVATAAGQGGRELESLKGLTVPVRIAGPLAGLSYRLEFGSLIQDAAQAGVERKKQQIRRKLQDGMQDKLRGIFGK